MTTLKVFRNVVGITWLGVTVWGVVALFRGSWVSLIVAVIAWIVCGVVFSSLHNRLQRIELSVVAELVQATAWDVEVGDWTSALSRSTRAVSILSASRRRDSGENMAVPLATMLVYHGLLLGANGRFRESQTAIERAAPAMERVGGSDAATAAFAVLVSDAEERFASPLPLTAEYFRQRVRALHAPI